VLNGGSGFVPDPAGQGACLRQLVPNHRIRQALFGAAAGQPGLTLLAGTRVAAVETGAAGLRLRLDGGGPELRARLWWPRMRASPRRVGSPASAGHGRLRRGDAGLPHGGVPAEWFGHGQTIAVLPLNGDLSSAVLTLPRPTVDRPRALEPESFGAEIARRYAHRLGAMRLVGTRQAFPLVAVYAHRFVGPRLALVGTLRWGCTL
jgi:2-polyprenyl-6-methoxyphenol hydroxylase-like FAD-dependent oxidoreductase